MKTNSQTVFKTTIEKVYIDLVNDSVNADIKRANQPLINFIEKSGLPLKNSMVCEITRRDTTHNVLNRGSIAESLIKMFLKGYKNTKKYDNNRCDMILNGVKYDIKYANSKTKASYTPSNKCNDIVMLTEKGLFITTLDNCILDRQEKHITNKMQNWNMVKWLLEF